MLRSTRRAGSVVAAMLLSACQLPKVGVPIVAPGYVPTAARVELDKLECQDRARRGGTTGTAGAAGGVAGGVMGAVGEKPGSAAADGSVGGAAPQGTSPAAEFKRAYIACMRGRGHDVIK